MRSKLKMRTVKKVRRKKVSGFGNFSITSTPIRRRRPARRSGAQLAYERSLITPSATIAPYHPTRRVLVDGVLRDVRY